MNREERAKQFASFDALKGLNEALKEKEWEHDKQQKSELSDESGQEINYTLSRLKAGDTVLLKYYDHGYYINIKGTVASVNPILRYLSIGSGAVFFDDIKLLKVLI